MAQPWKFHSLAVAVSSSVQALGAAAVVGEVSAGASALASAEAAGFACFAGLVSAGVLVSASASPFRKNSASLPSMELLKTRKDLPSGPTAISSGTPRRWSTTGDCFASVSQG